MGCLRALCMCSAQDFYGAMYKADFEVVNIIYTSYGFWYLYMKIC